MSHILSTNFACKTLAGFSLWCFFFLIPNTVQSATNNSALLQWSANSESDLAGYHIYQGTTPGSYGPFIDVGNITNYTASNLQDGQTYYFAVTAYDTSGNESSPSSEVSKYFEDVSLDVTPPAVSLTNPTNGATLSGTTIITASATDNIGVAGVQFQLNGQNLGTEDTVSPFSISWDTSAMPPNQYTLVAKARDAAGNTTTSVPLTVSTSSPFSTLSVAITGNGSVSSSPDGVFCDNGTCSASYTTGTTITLTPNANNRWNFSGWSGACSGTAECVILLSSSQSVEATFSKGGNSKGGGSTKGNGGNGKGRNK